MNGIGEGESGDGNRRPIPKCADKKSRALKIAVFWLFCCNLFYFLLFILFIDEREREYI